MKKLQLAPEQLTKENRYLSLYDRNVDERSSFVPFMSLRSCVT